MELTSLPLDHAVTIRNRVSRKRVLYKRVLVNLAGYPGQVFTLLAVIPQKGSNGKLNGLTRCVLGRKKRVKRFNVWELKHVFNLSKIKFLEE